MLKKIKICKPFSLDD